MLDNSINNINRQNIKAFFINLDKTIKLYVQHSMVKYSTVYHKFQVLQTKYILYLRV